MMMTKKEFEQFRQGKEEHYLVEFVNNYWNGCNKLGETDALVDDIDFKNHIYYEETTKAQTYYYYSKKYDFIITDRFDK